MRQAVEKNEGGIASKRALERRSSLCSAEISSEQYERVVLVIPSKRDVRRAVREGPSRGIESKVRICGERVGATQREISKEYLLEILHSTAGRHVVDLSNCRKRECVVDSDESRKILSP